MTAVSRLFWHGHGTAVAIYARRVSSGWNKAGHPLNATQKNRSVAPGVRVNLARLIMPDR